MSPVGTCRAARPPALGPAARMDPTLTRTFASTMWKGAPDIAWVIRLTSVERLWISPRRAWSEDSQASGIPSSTRLRGSGRSGTEELRARAALVFSAPALVTGTVPAARCAVWYSAPQDARHARLSVSPSLLFIGCCPGPWPHGGRRSIPRIALLCYSHGAIWLRHQRRVDAPKTLALAALGAARPTGGGLAFG